MGALSVAAQRVFIRLDLGGGINLYLKDESTHPSGSLKHRLARSLLLYALCNGWIGKGKPVIETEYNATLGTVGDLVLADLTQYLFIQKLLQTAASMHVAFATDEMAFRVTWRVDGKPAWVSALTPFKGSATQSPFVAIAT